MNLELHEKLKSSRNMDSSVEAVECLANQAGFDPEIQALLKVLSKDLRSSFDAMYVNFIKLLPEDVTES